MRNTNRVFRIELLCTLGFLIAFTATILLTRFATVDDFVFSNLTWAMSAEITGHVDMYLDPFPGYSVVCTIFANVLGLRYESVVALPFLAPLFVFTLMAIIRRMAGSPSRAVAILVMATWMLYFGASPTLFCHTIGLALFLVVMLVSLMRLGKQTPETQRNPSNVQSSIVLLVLVISINMVSYKLMMLTILFFVALQISLLFSRVRGQENPNNQLRGFMALTVFGITIALAFNWFFYRGFIPSILYSSGTPLDGIIRLFSALSSKEPTALSAYYFVGESNRLPLYLMWAGLILVSVILCYAILFLKTSRRISLSSGERAAVALISAGVVILMIYSALGLADLEYILVGGLLGYPVLFRPSHRHTRREIGNKIIAVFVLLMFSLTIIMNAFAVIDDSYGGQTDSNAFQYLEGPADWYIAYASDTTSTSTDILTWGYIMKDTSSLGEPESPYLHPFSEDDLLFILEPSLYQTHNSSLADLYVFNYRERYFSVYGWEKFESWSYHIPDVRNNPNLSVIYTSGAVDVCIR